VSVFSRDSQRSLILDRIKLVRDELEAFKSTENDDSDEGNEEKLEHAERVLEDLEATIEDLIP
jgi:hypothetical protein